MPSLNSDVYANLVADPQVLPESSQIYGKMRVLIANYVITAADATADVLRLFRVWSGWRFINCFSHFEALGGTFTVDYGLYDEAGLVAVDIDIVTSGAVQASGGAYVARMETAQLGQTLAGKRFWELAGATVDGNIAYTFASTLASVATPTAGAEWATILTVAMD